MLAEGENMKNKTKELRQAITRSWEGMSEEEDSSEDDNTTSTPNFFMELLNEC